MATDIFLIPIPPQQLRNIQGWSAQPAHLTYRVGRGPHLFRAGGSVPLRGGVMVVDGQGYDGAGPVGPFCQEVVSECSVRGFSGAVLDFDRRLPPLEQLAGQLDRLFAQRGPSTYFLQYNYPSPTAGSFYPPPCPGAVFPSGWRRRRSALAGTGSPCPWNAVRRTFPSPPPREAAPPSPGSSCASRWTLCVPPCSSPGSCAPGTIPI